MVGQDVTPHGFAYGPDGYLGDHPGVLDDIAAVVTVAAETWTGIINDAWDRGTICGWVVRDRAGRRLTRAAGRGARAAMARYAAGYAAGTRDARP